MNTIYEYEENTFNVKVYSKSGNYKVEQIRLRIGGDKSGDTNIIILYNGKCYIAKDYTTLYWNQEVDIEEINSRLEALEKLVSQIGNLNSLKTYNKDSFVTALNELVSINNNPRHLKGAISWVIEELTVNEAFNDLDIVYVNSKKSFYYYSKALNNLVPLEEEWIQLPVLVRTLQDANNILSAYNGKNIGVLEENQIYKAIGSNLIKVPAPKTNIGDEYIVRNVLQLNKQGSLIYLPTGWTYLIS